MSKKRIVVIGCGGIGGVIAARLTRAGLDVTPVCGNEQIAAAIAAQGFRVRELDGTTWSVAPSRPPRVRLEDIAREGAPFDLCLLATKATTLEPALASAVPYLDPAAPVITCQNGLPEEIAAGIVGVERVLGCVVVFGASMTAPGEYQLTSKGSLQLGRPHVRSPETGPAAGLLENVAPVTVVDDLAAARWSKLAINCATSTIGAVGGVRLGALLRHRFVRRLVLEIWTEIAAVARASGVRMAPLGGTLDIEKLALTPSERRAPIGSPALAWKHSLIVAVGVKYRRMRSSMLIALERGRTPEIDFLNGEIVRRGRALGVPVEVNEKLVLAVKALVDRRETPSLALLRKIYDEVVASDRAAA
jgi:2-dehydropantoate 2-reductase